MKYVILFAVVSALLIGCGGYNTGTILKAEKGFLKFSGNTSGIIITIDDGTPIPSNPKVELYEIKPGKHIIKIYRNKELIVNRIIIIDNQTIFEIEVP